MVKCRKDGLIDKCSYGLVVHFVANPNAGACDQLVPTREKLVDACVSAAGIEVLICGADQIPSRGGFGCGHESQAKGAGKGAEAPWPMSWLIDVVDAVVRVSDPGVDLKSALALPLPVKGVNRCLSFGFVDVPRAKSDAFGLGCEITSCGHESQAKGAISGVPKT